jgi:peptidoglycan/LPS O-acetylase OafA/YrhL
MDTPDPAPTLLGRLRRISSSGRFMPEIDGLRFIAIAGVVLTHLATFMVEKTGTPTRDYLYMVVAHGSYGVQLFFAISGFILSLPFAEGHLGLRPKPQLGPYYKRRVVRLEPPYLINLAILLLAMLILKGTRREGLGEHFLASAVYLHGLIYSDHSWINTVAWSLEVEVQFYILAPLFVSVFAIRNKLVRRGILIAAIAVSAVLNEKSRGLAYPLVYLSLAGYLHYFLVGFLLADWYLVDRPQTPEREYRWDLFGLAAWMALGLGLIKVATPRYLLMPLILVAYVAAFRGRLTNGLMRLPWLTTIGGMCYTIYLYHRPILIGIGEWSWSLHRPSWPYWANYLCQLAILGIPILILSGILFLLIERPFMRLASSRPTPQPPSAGPPAGAAGRTAC